MHHELDLRPWQLKLTAAALYSARREHRLNTFHYWLNDRCRHNKVYSLRSVLRIYTGGAVNQALAVSVDCSPNKKKPFFGGGGAKLNYIGQSASSTMHSC